MSLVEKVPPEIAAREVEIAVGRHREDKNFQTRKASFGQLCEIIDFVKGEKDGLCILQGALVGGQRIAKNVTRNYLMLFDHDTGESIEEIEKKIIDAGLFAVLWTTYNHMQAQTLIAEDALLKWIKKSGRAAGKDGITAEQAAEFLKETKKVKAEVFDADLKLERVHVEGGMKYRLTHAPMPRVRSMFVLKEPFDFAKRGGSQTAAIQEWKERYAGHATRLGLTWDRSCVDPSRLMYTPRVAPGTDLEALGHEIVVIPGKLLDIDAVPRLETEPRASGGRQRATGDLKAALSGEVGDPREPFKTPGLLAFLRDYAHDFEAATWLQDLAPEDVRKDHGDKIEFRCPWEDYHSEQKADDRAFAVWNASARDSGFDMRCQHNTCKDASKGDRAWFLDKLCEYYGVGVGELKEYCPSAEAEKEQEQRAVSDLEQKIQQLTPQSPAEETRPVLAELACMAIEERRHLVALFKTRTGWNKGEIDAAMKAHAKAAKEEEEDDNTPVDLPKPDQWPDESRCTEIWSHWDYEDQVRIARARLITSNQENPTIFARPEGPVKLVERPLGLLAIPVKRKAQYQVALEDCLKFYIYNKKTDTIRGVAPFPDVIEGVIGRDLGCFHPLDRIVRVPVFAADGSLRTEAGYHPELQCYLDPRMEFRPVPDVITEEHLDEACSWLFEAIRDFSFSDAFDGNDELPIRDGSVDEENFPMPNLARGVSSRAAIYAAIMQGFMRNCIDGPTPIYAIDKPVAGEGAGFLTDVISYILEGGKPFAGTMQKDISEFKKEIVATLLSSTNIAFYDNVDFHIDNPVLAAALTAGNFRGRILGLSQNADVPIRLLWIIAGKNLSMTAELMRRVVPIKIDSNMEHPERDRPPSWYKHDLHEFLAAHRADFVWAAHVIGKNWFQKGCPKGKMSFESFNNYAAVMGGVLEAAGLPGFLENRSRYLGEKSVEDDSEKNFVAELYKRYNGNEVELKIIIGDLLGDPMNTALVDLLNTDLTKMQDRQLATKLGYHIRKYMSGRTYNLDGKRFKLHIVSDRRPVRYRLLPIGD